MLESKQNIEKVASGLPLPNRKFVRKHQGASASFSPFLAWPKHVLEICSVPPIKLNYKVAKLFF